MRLVAVDPVARRIGLHMGMSLSDARAISPHLDLREHDAAAYDKRLTAIADWCRRFTPLAALDAPDGCMLDMTGAAHLFGGIEKAMRE
ncbi:MAG: hypothetical protein RL735_961, partial [Pseudomonadota bacterium]